MDKKIVTISCLTLVFVLFANNEAIAAANACSSGSSQVFSPLTYYIALLYMAACLFFPQLKNAVKRQVNNIKNSFVKVEAPTVKESNV
ncbi:MAG: hypothetical protein PQ612_08320 [Rickettsiales bacterium]|nr:hypothetical protein [Pseudomonadota bacterium]MDA0966774.1 hypothetical protein [Pseudomonadota bacterium]MDG4543446.1 hypothetical protein [Rickettsiales bacterium]MDG4546160.1 hypothetical protein [Rickettsiales bacterium]MDG4547633.1 hypothetical protein [Rickettsiales bacterium]